MESCKIKLKKAKKNKEIYINIHFSVLYIKHTLSNSPAPLPVMAGRREGGRGHGSPIYLKEADF